MVNGLGARLTTESLSSSPRHCEESVFSFFGAVNATSSSLSPLLGEFETFEQLPFTAAGEDLGT
jgi:hypothetical protein